MASCILFILFFRIVSTCFNLPSADPSTITDVHIVTSNHLDVGYTSYIFQVIERYWYSYYPQIEDLANSINSNYKFMTHSWLIDLFFDCPPNLGVRCPKNKEIKYLTKIINNQQLYWHAFPFNSQISLYDNYTFQFGLQLSKRLSSKFINALQSTVISQRDVPGLSRSVIPILKQNNITALSVGV
eukprot:538316_1